MDIMPEHIFPNKTNRWPPDTWKDAQHHKSTEKLKLNLQQDSTSHLLYWPLLRKQKTMDADEDGEKGAIVHSWWKCNLVQSPWRTIWKCLKKLKNVSTTCSSNSTTGYIPKGNKNSILKIYMHSHFYCSPIHNSHDTERTCPSTDE